MAEKVATNFTSADIENCSIVCKMKDGSVFATTTTNPVILALLAGIETFVSIDPSRVEMHDLKEFKNQ